MVLVPGWLLSYFSLGAAFTAHFFVDVAVERAIVFQCLAVVIAVAILTPYNISKNN
jgi:hypothetical protein